jgi:DNA invertase Pin-like site-specific DNA recombinase
MKRAAIYLRVSTVDQTVANQEQALRDTAERSGLEIVAAARFKVNPSTVQNISRPFAGVAIAE